MSVLLAVLIIEQWRFLRVYYEYTRYHYYQKIFFVVLFLWVFTKASIFLFLMSTISVKWCQRMRDALLLASDESIWKAKDFLKGDDDNDFFGKARDVKKADSLRHFSSQGKRETVWVFADYSNFSVPASSSQLCSPMCLCCCCCCFYVAVDIVALLLLLLLLLLTRASQESIKQCAVRCSQWPS